MDVKGTLKAITLEFRRELEGRYDAQGTWEPGDLERRLAAIGVRRDRAPVPVDELPHLAPEDREARRVVDAFLQSRAEARQSREAAIAEFVRDAAYTWANRLLALRCMEARSLIDEVILQKDAYGGRSLQHNRLAKKQPERCAGEDEGLFAALFDEFARRAEELPLLFDPRVPEVALRPSIAAVKRCVALLSGTLAVRGQEAASDEVFTSPDTLGWTYQFYQEEEKDRVDDWLKRKKGFKCEGADLVPKTTLYTEPYMVRFLVQNSLGAIWMGTYPASRLAENWEYYVGGADRAPASKKAVADITFLDPACGSGHFLIEAFELFYAMYFEEGAVTDPAQICASILERNLYGIDIDERAVQIAALALVMKAKEKAPGFSPRRVNIVATNIRLPAGKEHLEAFLRKHPEDAPLKPALLAIFEGLAHADELGSLLQIEEPVDRELRHLRDEQLSRERKAGAGTLFGLRKDEEWSAWKHEAIARLREHFGTEAQEVDLAAAFFGEAATKGLSLVELLSRRYDVVATNPPYLGSKYMGALIKRYLDRHFEPGKRDLYAAFVLRALGLTENAGRVAMVTQQSWMFARSYVSLRSCADATASAPSFRGLLSDTMIETLAHLGPRAFTDIGGEIVNVALVVFSHVPAGEKHRLTAFRLIGPRSPTEKASLLRASIKTPGPILARPRQSDLRKVPESPVVYYLSESLLNLLTGERKLRDVAEVRQGMATSNNDRFVRCFWEAAGSPRWVPYAKGGGYSKWAGLDWLCVDWEHHGLRLRLAEATLRATEWYFKPGLTYSPMSGGALGTRLLDGAAFDVKGASLFVRDDRESREVLAAHLNTHLVSFLTRAISQSLELHVGYLALVPVPQRWAPECDLVAPWAFGVKRKLVERNLVERCFRAEAQCRTHDGDPLVPLLLAAEGLLERAVFHAYDVGDDDIATILHDTGTPSAWFPMIAGYDAVPAIGEVSELPREVQIALEGHERRVLEPADLEALKLRIAGLYQEGPGGRPDDGDEESGGGSDSEEGEDSNNASGAHIPIPAETFLEELALTTEVHPVSVFWLVRELREQRKLTCPREERRILEDYVTTIVLRLLGHRWPADANQRPAWVDPDGIIALSIGTEDLARRVRERLAEDAGEEVSGWLHRFEDLVGRSLDDWLGAEFFKRHISQFKKRPIAWQLTSSGGNSVKRRGRGGPQNTPAFSCLVYYHRLDADLLPKLRTQYVGPLRTSLQTELGSLERLRDRSADQDARRLELEGKVEELKAFDARLEQVFVGGFASPTLDRLAAKEPLDKWASRDSRSRAPETRDAFLAQERKYDPDLNDGVRVNIAPLQRAGLLAADVLAAKDIEKAIADRAEWRADERRWCREGKLPQPGWWPTGKET